jgi:hypothetical protein
MIPSGIIKRGHSGCARQIGQPRETLPHRRCGVRLTVLGKHAVEAERAERSGRGERIAIGDRNGIVRDVEPLLGASGSRAWWFSSRATS